MPLHLEAQVLVHPVCLKVSAIMFVHCRRIEWALAVCINSGQVVCQMLSCVLTNSGHDVPGDCDIKWSASQGLPLICQFQWVVHTHGMLGNAGWMCVHQPWYSDVSIFLSE